MRAAVVYSLANDKKGNIPLQLLFYLPVYLCAYTPMLFVKEGQKIHKQAKSPTLSINQRSSPKRVRAKKKIGRKI